MARPPSRAERQSRSPEKPRPIQVAAKCGGCFGAFLGIVAKATTFVARLAFIRILPATQSAWDLFRGSSGVQRIPSRSAIIQPHFHIRAVARLAHPVLEGLVGLALADRELRLHALAVG